MNSELLFDPLASLVPVKSGIFTLDISTDHCSENNPRNEDACLWHFKAIDRSSFRCPNWDDFILSADKRGNIVPKKWLQPLLNKNRAFFLRKDSYDHFVIMDEPDTRRVVGVIYGRKDRIESHCKYGGPCDADWFRDDAEQFLKRYSQWCLGNVRSAYIESDYWDGSIGCSGVSSGTLFPGEEGVNWDGLTEFVFDMLRHLPKPWFIACDDNDAREDLERVGYPVVLLPPDFDSSIYGHIPRRLQYAWPYWNSSRATDLLNERC